MMQWSPYDACAGRLLIVVSSQNGLHCVLSDSYWFSVPKCDRQFLTLLVLAVQHDTGSAADMPGNQQ